MQTSATVPAASRYILNVVPSTQGEHKRFWLLSPQQMNSLPIELRRIVHLASMYQVSMECRAFCSTAKTEKTCDALQYQYIKSLECWLWARHAALSMYGRVSREQDRHLADLLKE